MIVYLNGKFISESNARLSIDDHGFLYGDGVYETLRVYDGVPFLLKQHLDRLEVSLKGIGLASPVSMRTLEKAALRLIGLNRLKQSAMRITITRGPGPHGLDPRLCRQPTVLITVRPFKGYPPEFYDQGITAAVVSIRRNPAWALPPSIKSINCLNGILAKQESLKMAAHEAILLDDRNRVAEGTVSNVFIVKRNVIFTPSLEGNLLPGVTRWFVCHLAKKARLRVVSKRLTVAELANADEVFLTSSLMEVVPVARLTFHRSHGKRSRRFKKRTVTSIVADLLRRQTGA